MGYAIVGLASLLWIIAFLCAIIFAILRRWRLVGFSGAALAVLTVIGMVAAALTPTPKASTAAGQTAQTTIVAPTPSPEPTATPEVSPTPTPTKGPTPKPKPTSQADEDKKLYPGYVAVVKSNARNLPCYREQTDLDEAAKALEAKDKVGFNEHASGDKTMLFKGGEHVRFIDRSGFLDPDVRLRLESGENKDEACWVKDADKAAFDNVHED